MNPSPFEIIATSIGSLTVSDSLDTFLLNEVKFTKVFSFKTVIKSK